jgi:hypothetical protein
MEGNDIGLTVHRHVACMFEGLVINVLPAPEEKRSFSLFKRSGAVELPSEEEYVKAEMRRWKVNEMPLKSLIHMTTKLGISCEVYSFMDPMFREPIEHWLARKGADCTVWCYEDLSDLREDFKYNRDVHTFFTPNQEVAASLGMRATVVNPDGTFGI